MAAITETDIPPSPMNEDSGEDDEEFAGFENDNEGLSTKNNNVADLLKKLQSSGALISKPKQEYHCQTCDEDFTKWLEFHDHLLNHVSTSVYVLLNRLPDDFETANSEDNWSDEDEEEETPQSTPKMPQKVDISHILKKTGLSIKSSGPTDSGKAALDKLSGLGFTIKSTTPIKQEIKSEDKSDNKILMKKLGDLGGLKLKLKSDDNAKSFSVINGLRDFKTSDNEDSDEEPPADEHMEDSDEDKQHADAHDEDSDGNASERHDNSDNSPNESESPPKKVKPITILKSSIIKSSGPDPPFIIAKPIKTLVKKSVAESENTADVPVSANVPEKVIKEEVVDNTTNEIQTPLFNEQPIKSERLSPPPEKSSAIVAPIPATATVKTENEISSSNQTNLNTAPLLVPKKEDMDIIEINCDDDDDDDCCVVSTTPAPDVKPSIVPKIEKNHPPVQASTSHPTSSANQPGINILSNRLMSPTTPLGSSSYQPYNESKPLVDLGEKGVDDIFDSLFSTHKKEQMDTNEYISLDRLGSQHTCDVCNTRFTDPSMLDLHIRNTGHSKSVVTTIPPQSHLLPYGSNSSNSLLSSLFPVKQLAEQVGKLSNIPASSPFTHQQNVMINIQAYPGAGGMMPNQPYNNAYGPGQMAPPPYPNTSNMYGPQGQQMPGQNYNGTNFGMGQQSYPGQPPYMNGMPKAAYPGASSMGAYSTAPDTPYTPSPLQSMQQAVYGQNSGINSMGQPVAPGQPMNTMAPGQPMNTMAPGQPMNPTMIPGQSPTIAPGAIAGPHGQSFPPVSSPGGMKSATSGPGIKIKNIQTITPGQTVLGPRPPVQVGGNPRMRPPGIRMAPRPGGPRPGTSMGSPRAKAPPGGAAGPRMQVKRAGGPSPGGPSPKRRDMLLPGKHDNEDCQVMSMQKQQEGMPLIQRVHSAKDKFSIGKGVTITKKPPVNKEANAMANVLASRGIMVKQKAKSRSPSPQRPLPHIPNLGSDVSVKHSGSRSSSGFSIPEAKIGGGELPSCTVCGKMFGNQSSLAAHMSAVHPYAKMTMFKCDECPAVYSKSLQLQHHKRVFHTVSGANRELGLPVVDLSQEDNLRKLSDLGIYSFIPLANREQASGCFGIPVISVHTARNGKIDSLHALGADGLLSLGPLKALPNT